MLYSPKSGAFARRALDGLILIGLSAAIQVSHAQSISEVVSTALRNDPRIKEATAGVLATEAEIAIASSAANSRVSVSGSVGAERVLGSAGGWPSASPAVHWTKLLSDGGRVDRDIDLRKARVRQALSNVRVVEEDAALQIAQVYVQLAQAKEALVLTRKWVNSLTTIEDMTREISELDKGRQFDRIQAASRASAARAQMASRQASVAQAARQLEQLVSAHIYVETPISLTLHVEHEAPPLSTHPRAQVARAAAQIAEAQLALDNLYDKPKFEIDAYVGAGRDSEGRLRWVNQGGLRLVGSLDILDGGFGRATADASRRRLNQAQISVDGTLRDLRVALSRDVAANEEAEARLAAYTASLAEAEGLRPLMFEQFKAGRRPLLDLLTQEAEIYQSALSRSQELYDSLTNKIRIAHERGELLATFGIPSALASQD